mmetsp:Transcript_7425/g.10708  ORF Transcript_7425/g.10708 Transcript_7425/m.10708 type:complete len:284 (-) Transcript_7425:177-1028(-)|eukprot:CAMPEP_0194757634 /NCGR_PEP_ID=MMETSP0323_2-20130528/11095_1 /TAXON_ID=2866 ORGANISM="Crypthecodinium cohnii, Strain Seligo" /NCGR_SAMPLE_ID=MMETSP0323_2 /ASSEMBLY_ACC=CAM_ASM_000346 /LENGTH=283 /DNA_ID=CAMNT_0039677653 /DNA_START=26 /DNA_END=877 /DNA_ORIENTATION=+
MFKLLISTFYVAAVATEVFDERLSSELLLKEDECGNIPDGDCSVHLLQRLRQTRAVSAVTYREQMASDEIGILLTNSFKIGPGHTFDIGGDCSRTAYEKMAPNLTLYDGFGAGGGGGSWRASSLYILNGPNKSQVDFNHTVMLKVNVETAPSDISLQNCTLNVAAANQIPSVADTMELGCPHSDACLPAEPAGPGVVGIPPRPRCGWSSVPSEVASQPGLAAGEKQMLLFDITEMVKKGATSFKMWTVPSELSNSGMWQIAPQIIKSWGFVWVPLQQKLHTTV